MDAVAVKTNKFGGGVRSCNIELFRILSMLMIVAHPLCCQFGFDELY